jgi:hypothetical protein
MNQLEVLAVQDSQVIVDTYDSISDYVVTNADFVELLEQLINYNFSEDEVYTVPGETSMEGDYEEYHVDDSAFYDMIIRIFYQEVSE